MLIISGIQLIGNPTLDIALMLEGICYLKKNKKLGIVYQFSVEAWV